MNRARPCWRALDNCGVAAIEFALVVPVFLVLVFGIIETGRLMWQQVSMQRAVAVAARCGALATPGCISDLEVRNRAVTASARSGLTLANVTVSRETCGVKVVATRNFTFAISMGSSLALNAYACHPLLR